MSPLPDRAVIEQAIAWHLRLQDADEVAWTEFAEWLERDPAHNAAYERVVDGDARMPSLLECAQFPTDDERERPSHFGSDEDFLADVDRRELVRRRQWRWGALAASFAVAGLIGVQMLPSQDTLHAIETLPGQTRTVSLADGSQILLNGGTKVVLDKADARSVEIARGEARFIVRHDETDPFIVVAGEQRLVDMGTEFNVVRTERQLRVGVTEGAVRYEAAARTVDLRPGDSLAADSGGKIEVSRKPIATIGSWAEGKLVYDQVPLEQVADDLSRSVGISLELPRSMRSRRFSGVIQTHGGRDALRARLEELVGETIVVDGTRWTVDAR